MSTKFSDAMLIPMFVCYCSMFSVFSPTTSHHAPAFVTSWSIMSILENLPSVALNAAPSKSNPNLSWWSNKTWFFYKIPRFPYIHQTFLDIAIPSPPFVACDASVSLVLCHNIPHHRPTISWWSKQRFWRFSVSLSPMVHDLFPNPKPPTWWLLQ